MNSYGLIDLHCDTLAEYWKYAHTGNPDTLDDPGRVLSLSNMPKDVHWAQFYAVFIPDEEHGQAAIDYFEKNRANFYRQMEKFGDRVAPCRNADDMEKAWAAGKTAAFLTIENGSALAGDLSRVHTLAEQGVRAILGQLVSVAMAAKLTARVAQLYGERLDDFPEYICFPTPQRLAAADPQALKALGMPLKRAEALIHLANAALEGTLPMTIPGDVEQAMKTLQTFPGIGRWTANYFALRGWQAKDVFLPDDYLIKQRFPGMTPAQIRRYAERWKPWRSYALLHIWYTEGWQPDEA